MSQNKIIELKKPGEFSEDPLTELLRNGARQLISDAVEAELQELLNQYEVRNRFLQYHATLEIKRHLLSVYSIR